MTITFADPGWPWTLQWWHLGITAALIAFAVVALTLASRLNSGAWGIPGALALVVPFFPGLIIQAFLIPDTYLQRVENATVVALEDAGFTSVTLDQDRFTASLTGAYFDGVLIELPADPGEYAYQIAEVEK